MLLVVGDFNVWADVDSDNEVGILLDLMNAYGMMQTIQEPTHTDIEKDTRWIISASIPIS